ncbi:hypothetical protein ACERK3_15260 [Phycisphaerales bacterium AB-hyl4]|uniref:Uncharacterized protein n=1 Tax=Natronomicrosphaera hydrolytica TaxID=3242702 RepID=A0ABV4U7Z9_9BACT
MARYSALNPSFEVPPAFWAAVNVAIGVVSGVSIPSWQERFYLPIGFGLLMALLALLDKRKVMRQIGGDPRLWKQIPSNIRTRYMGRLFVVRLLIVLVPGVLAALAAGLIMGDMTTTQTMEPLRP